MNNYCLLVLDSCRHDSVAAAWPELVNLPELGELRVAYSFATWTHPAHLSFLTGRLPWIEEDGATRLRSGGQEYYRDLDRWEWRLGVELDHLTDRGLDIRPKLHQLGYEVVSIVLAKPIGPGTLYAGLFDRYEYVGRTGNTFDRVLRVLERWVDPSTPMFAILNISETHFPYFDGSYTEQFETRRVPSWSRRVTRGLEGAGPAERIDFSDSDLAELRRRQVRSVQYVDNFIPRLKELLGDGAIITVTADHGDCLGESGQFLHGEVWDPTVLRVPFVEGRVE